jgi:hypothetical protein
MNRNINFGGKRLCMSLTENKENSTIHLWALLAEVATIFQAIETFEPQI